MGTYKAIDLLYPAYFINGFMVSSLKDNPRTLAGLPVREIRDAALTDEDKSQTYIVIAAPENVHPKIIAVLKQYGYENYICIDSRREALLMERYYKQKGIFPQLHDLPEGTESAKLQIYQAKFHKDEPLRDKEVKFAWIVPIQVGADLTSVRVARICDNTGENISYKNGNYCELTALYWIWKNVLSMPSQDDAAMVFDYCGLFHYRRILDICENDLYRLRENDVDVILPYPMIHEPDIREHHTRYVKGSDWQAMLMALQEISPEYYEAYGEIFSQEYLYNYNILIAKPEILRDYCEWLFPILERTEEVNELKETAYTSRYIGYLGENLLTLYFMYNKYKLHIVHTGRIMLT